MPLPLVPVSDGAGVIVDRSPGAEKFKHGALVMPIHVPGWTGGRPEHDATPRGGPAAGVLARFVVFDAGEAAHAAPPPSAPHGSACTAPPGPATAGPLRR